MRSIFIKELREITRWSPIGMLLIGLLALMQLPSVASAFIDLPIQIAFVTVLGASVVALALGLLQSVFDMRPDVRGYLLHRPISTATIFWAKVVAGLLVYSITISIPLSLIAIYLECMGPERWPTAWTDVIPAAIACLAALTQPSSTESFVLAGLTQPPALSLAVLSMSFVFVSWEVFLSSLAVWLVVLAHFVVAAAVSYWLTAGRTLTRQSRFLWTIVGGMLSVGAWLAIVAI